MSDANLRESDATLREQWLTAEQAASLLSVSVRTVQKRAREGKLPSRLEGRRLFVSLSLRESDANLREHDAKIREHDAKIRESSFRNEDSTHALIAQQQSEIAFLRERVQQHETAEGELRRLMMADKHELQELRQKVALLLPPAPQESPPMSTEGTESAQEASGRLTQGERENAPMETQAPPEGPTRERERQRRWWQVWRR